jgi:mRNA-degrading endonuclease RelE of RelBE toxin-antitoxin system
MRTLLFTPDFEKALKKLDPSIQNQILKRIQKIIQMPGLGKPLHAPLANHFSERIGAYRVIYTFSSETITFSFLDHRDNVYKKR